MKRFYKAVTVQPEGGGWQVRLDGRGVKTPARSAQVVPTRLLAEAMADEWASQGEEIDASTFPLRDLADYAIDAVGPDRQALIDEIAAYAETDTLCYRGDEGEPLHERQLAMWEPLLVATEQRRDIRFERISGVIHRPQPGETLAKMHAAVAAQDDYSLAALKMLTSLTASLVISLAAIEPGADAEVLWAAANLEEDWQAELWGLDFEAQKRMQTRLEAFKLAIRFALLARS